MLECRDISIQAGHKFLFSCDQLVLVKGLYALVGRNGSGKSTFLSAIMGELEVKGEIELADVLLKEHSSSKLSTLVSIVRSRPVLYGEYKVNDILMLGRLPYQGMLAIPSKEDKEAVQQIAADLGINEFLDRDYNTLSDGEKQLVMVGRAMVQDTPIILLDEPTAFLDLVNRFELLKHLRKLSDEKNKLIVFSTHHVEILPKFCDGVLLISDQRLKVLNNSQDFFVRDFKGLWHRTPMKWRTEVNIEPNYGFLTYDHSILSIGSCFADEIGHKLKRSGFDIDVNPFGVIFNPVSLLQLIQDALDENPREQFIVERAGKWYHYGYHSEVFGESSQDLLEKVQKINHSTKLRIASADHLFLTFGTTWVYRLLQNELIVANCHKMPAELFHKERIGLKRLDEFSMGLFTRLFELNPKLKVTLTVSPVRHSKDGLHENNLSKSVLHLYCDFLQRNFENINYFPAYELVVDELRDYRFYKEDLVHPNEQALEYVFNKFGEAYFDPRTSKKYELYEKLRKAESHEHMNASKEEKEKHEEFINDLKAKLSSS